MKKLFFLVTLLYSCGWNINHEEKSKQLEDNSVFTNRLKVVESFYKYIESDNVLTEGQFYSLFGKSWVEAESFLKRDLGQECYLNETACPSVIFNEVREKHKTLLTNNGSFVNIRNNLFESSKSKNTLECHFSDGKMIDFIFKTKDMDLIEDVLLKDNVYLLDDYRE